MKTKMTPRTRRRGPRKWRESFTVWIDFIGDRSQIGPLLDFIAGAPSDGGGTFLIGPPLSDQSWTFSGTRNYRQPRGCIVNPSPGARADECFDRLKAAACRARWSPYIRLRLMHDDIPERCKPAGIVREITRSGKTIYRVMKHERADRGPLVLRKYQRGKLPKMPVRKLQKKGARPNAK